MARWFAALAAALLLAAPARADYDSGAAAYLRGQFTRAFEAWQPLAEAGHPRAQLALGKLYAEGRGVEKDEKTAFAWFRKAADQDLVEAQLRVGEAYLYGTGTPADPKAAADWFKRASDKGDMQARFTLAAMYMSGTGVERGFIPNDPELPLPLAQVHPIADVVKVDYFLPGCPPSADAIWKFFTELIGGRTPRLGHGLLRYD